MSSSGSTTAWWLILAGLAFGAAVPVARADSGNGLAVAADAPSWSRWQGRIALNTSTPLWRADLMPYGGLKGSGIGKEGPRTAVAEMTEEKTIVLHGRPW